MLKRGIGTASDLRRTSSSRAGGTLDEAGARGLGAHAGALVAALAATFVVAGAEAGPGGEVLPGGERLNVGADLDQDRRGGGAVDSRLQRQSTSQ